ncbi:hypothetical protein JX266_010513 [Neoarthrinium moseri]|nr:hypothetical protein JX266_010513 [Neoarthrinium moseri]
MALAEGELNGFPANPYDPFCAMSCLRSLSSLMLDCSGMDGGTLGMMMMSTTSACWASNTPYLTSLSWCMHTKCAEFNIPNSKLEYFWETEATGQASAGVQTESAKWSFAEALANVEGPPSIQLQANDTWLNVTSLVSPEVYVMQWNVLTSVQRETSIENAYGIALLVTGFALPIFCTILGSLPLLSGLSAKLKPYVIWPSVIGTYHIRPLPYLLGNAPTLGQSIYISLFVVLNIILTAVNYQSKQPNAWYSTQWGEIMAYVLWRTGALAYIIAPLIFLFAGRNNILLWLTNWSHSTFLVLHRWVARIFAIQAILHSILAVVLHKHNETYDVQVSQPYWIWGIVATLCTVILTFGSSLHIRSYKYELFLVVHIVLSVVLVVGCWYHAYDLYKFLGGYLDWMYAIAAVWFTDRLVRVVRIMGHGPCRAKLTNIGDDYVRIDIPGIYLGAEPGKHIYVYFPTITPLRFWENHPFSVLSTALLPGIQNTSTGGTTGDVSDTPGSPMHDVEKSNKGSVQEKPLRNLHPAAGLTLYVRRSKGTTKLLQANNDLMVLLEGPYLNNSTRQLLRCDRLLLISGGIGITAVLPFASRHWNVKLAWSLKESARCLKEDMAGALGAIADNDIRVGSRLDISRLLDSEIAAGWTRVGVVVSGPAGLCDDTRAAVVAAAKLGYTKFEFEVEAYSW